MTPIKFTFLSSRALQKDSDRGAMALIVPSIILLCRRLLTSLYKVVASASVGWNWIIIIPRKTWEGEKTLRGGDICDLVTKSFGLLVWLFPLPGAFSVEAQGWVVVVVHLTCHASGMRKHEVVPKISWNYHTSVISLDQLYNLDFSTKVRWY